MQTPAAEDTSPHVEAIFNLDRRSKFELVSEIHLGFPTHHPQGMAFANGLTFLSSVEILRAPRPSPDPALRSRGQGKGHVFVIGTGGDMIHDLDLGEDSLYHPGGIDFDGDHVWVSAAEYRAGGSSIIYTVDPDTFEVQERFRVDDHIGWVLRDPSADLVFGGSWGSRHLYTWDTGGRLVDKWENPGHFVDYQDAQFLQPGLLLCSGISLLPQNDGTAFELGGLALVEPHEHNIRKDVPINVFSPAGHVITRNPMTISADDSGLLFHTAPDDGQDTGGTRIFSYRIT